MVWQKVLSRILIKTFQTFKIITHISKLAYETCESDIEILDKSHVKSTKVPSMKCFFINHTKNVSLKGLKNNDRLGLNLASKRILNCDEFLMQYVCIH